MTARARADICCSRAATGGSCMCSGAWAASWRTTATRCTASRNSSRASGAGWQLEDSSSCVHMQLIAPRYAATALSPAPLSSDACSTARQVWPLRTSRAIAHDTRAPPLSSPAQRRGRRRRALEPAAGAVAAQLFCNPNTAAISAVVVAASVVDSLRLQVGPTGD